MVNSYIALDLETTGLNPKTDRILEIGAVRVVDGAVTDSYQTFVDAGMKISKAITDLTGISDDMISGGKAPKEAVCELIEFCEGYDLLGHNIQFDYSFIKRSAVNQYLPFEKQGIDTLKIARKLLPELDKRSLDYLCNYYSIDRFHKHRAYDDAVAAKELYDKMWQQFGGERESDFRSFQLVYQVKKEGPITISQKGYLNDLLKYHKIEPDVLIDTMTKNEASRLIDKIILKHGKISRRW